MAMCLRVCVCATYVGFNVCIFKTYELLLQLCIVCLLYIDCIFVGFASKKTEQQTTIKFNTKSPTQINRIKNIYPRLTFDIKFYIAVFSLPNRQV